MLERIKNCIGAPDMDDKPQDDNPLDNIPSFDRLSFQVVLVGQGEDPGQALSDAGIFDPVALPVVLGENPTLSTGILGDGITPNVAAVLETRQEDGHGDAQPVSSGRRQSVSGKARPVQAVAEALPAAGGDRAFAPVRQRDG